MSMVLSGFNGTTTKSWRVGVEVGVDRWSVDRRVHRWRRSVVGELEAWCHRCAGGRSDTCTGWKYWNEREGGRRADRVGERKVGLGPDLYLIKIRNKGNREGARAELLWAWFDAVLGQIG